MSDEDFDAESLLEDKAFFKSAGVNNMGEVRGKEKSLIALRNTYKNIDKAENVSDLMRGMTTQNWL